MGKQKKVFEGEVSSTVTSQPLFEMTIQRARTRWRYLFSVKLDEKIGDLPDELGVVALLKDLVVLRKGDKVRMYGVVLKTSLEDWNVLEYRLQTEKLVNETLRMGCP